MVEKNAPSTLSRHFDRGVKLIALSLYALMIFVVGLQILVRWVIGSLIGSSLPWTVNLSQMLLVYVTFMGAAVASGKGEHISLDLLSARLSDFKVRLLVGFQAVLVIVFVTILIAGAYPLYQHNRYSVIGALPTYPPFTQGWLYVPAIVGGTIIIIYAIRDLWNAITEPEAVIAKARGDDEYGE